MSRGVRLKPGLTCWTRRRRGTVSARVSLRTVYDSLLVRKGRTYENNGVAAVRFTSTYDEGQHTLCLRSRNNFRWNYGSIVRYCAIMPATNARHAALGGGGQACNQEGNRLLTERHTRKNQNDIPMSICWSNRNIISRTRHAPTTRIILSLVQRWGWFQL